MKPELGKIYIIDVRDKKTQMRSTYFGHVQAWQEGRYLVSGYYARFITGWIWADEIEWLSTPFPLYGPSDTENDWMPANIGLTANCDYSKLPQ